MGYVKEVCIYVDSSHRPKDGMCQAGIVYHDPWSNRIKSFSSDVFEAENNNDAEIMGIYLAIKSIHEEFDTTSFRIFNDNIIACTMLRADKQISKKMLHDHPVLEYVLYYIYKNKLRIRTEHISRSHKIIKVCDKLSKKFRHKEKS